MVVEQFLLSMGNHELSVQVAAHGHRQVGDILTVARLLEVVQEEEKFHSSGHKPDNQACFMTNECDQSPTPSNWLRMCWHIWARMISLAKVCGNLHPPLGQSRLEALIGRKSNLLILPRMPRPGKGGRVDLLLQRGAPTVKMNHSSVTTAKDMGILMRGAGTKGFIR